MFLHLGYFLLFLFLFTALTPSEEVGPEGEEELLERLAYKYGTDKSKDDHKYTDFYTSLFHERRLYITNMTEIGIAAGQSIQCWHEYFPNSEIHGFDVGHLNKRVRANLEALERVRIFMGDVRDKKEEERLDFVPESMDIVIDDAGIHKRSLQEGLLATMWKYVKPGGYYIMEDVDGKRGGFDYETNHSLSSSTIGILENNHAFMVNPTIGHRAWRLWEKKSTKMWVLNRRIHNSYLLVIRKRRGKVPPIKMHVGSVAMNPAKIQLNLTKAAR